MRIQNAKKITLETVPAEQQQSVSMIASVVNQFMEDVTTVINGNIGLDNTTRKVISIQTQTNSKGDIITQNEVRVGINNPLGCNVVNIYMTDNPSQTPNITSAPFVCFTPLGNGVVKLTKILNLQQNSKYTIVLEFI